MTDSPYPRAYGRLYQAVRNFLDGTGGSEDDLRAVADECERMVRAHQNATAVGKFTAERLASGALRDDPVS